MHFCRVFKEYLISRTCKFYKLLWTKCGNFDTSRLLITNCCEVINSPSSPVFPAHRADTCLSSGWAVDIVLSALNAASCTTDWLSEHATSRRLHTITNPLTLGKLFAPTVRGGGTAEALRCVPHQNLAWCGTWNTLHSVYHQFLPLQSGFTSLQMQGAINGKTMHAMCASFVLFHSNRLHICTTTIKLWKKIQWNTCHQTPSLAFRFYQIPHPHSTLPSCLGRFVHRYFFTNWLPAAAAAAATRPV